MAVAIRLKRVGTKKKAYFHVVATDSRNARDGRYLEKLGHYDPRVDPPIFTLDRERLDYWVSQGAKTSQTVSQLVEKYGGAAGGAEPEAKDGGKGADA
jgi:small subunit ribosomal protein S16